MTQKELLSLEHLKIAEVKEGYFLHVHTEDGYFLTSWKEGDDIKEYSGSICMYAPIVEDYPDYRVISESEHNNLEKMRDEELVKESKRMREEERNRENAEVNKED